MDKIVFLSISFVFIFLIVIIIVFRKQIGSFFYPENYIMVEMLELDNNTKSWIEEKNKDLKFKFNENFYNMFHHALDENGNRVLSPAIYREGRLAKFFYHEGFSDPIDYRQGKISGNMQITKELQKQEISKLFEDDTNIAQEFFQKYGLWILIGVIALVLYIIFRKPPVTPGG